VLHLAYTTDIRSTRECRSLSEKFEAYFVENTRKIKTAIKQLLVNLKADLLQSDQAYSDVTITTLLPPSVEEVRKLIGSMPAKSSPTDCIPTSVLKLCADSLPLLIARLTALCLEGVFPTRYKTACITPLIKKKELNAANVDNYIPVSNLHTISKIVG
jgi:hypothetical protein